MIKDEKTKTRRVYCLKLLKLYLFPVSAVALINKNYIAEDFCHGLFLFFCISFRFGS